VELILFARKAPRQQSGDLLRAAATKMRDQQQNPKALRHVLLDSDVILGQ
jgi:hypothetical protein